MASCPSVLRSTLRLRDTTSISLDKGGWVLLGERPRDEIALGLVGKFWRPVIEFASVSAERFRDFAEPGYAKTIYSLSVRPIDERRTLLSGVMRTATTDEHARRWFRRYWTFGVGSGAHILVNGLIDVTRAWALDSLATRSIEDSSLRPIVRRALKEFDAAGSEALQSRARHIRLRLASSPTDQPVPTRFPRRDGEFRTERAQRAWR
jgi:hypothetical protein